MCNKKNRQFRRGFLLVEFITGFAMLTFFILIFAQSFYYSISEYKCSKDRLHILERARNEVEKYWLGQKKKVRVSGKLDIKRFYIPIIAPATLPHTPRYAQEIVEVSCKDQSGSQKVQLSCGIMRK